MELFKEYQVVEHIDGQWSVVKISSRAVLGSHQQSAVIEVAAYSFNTAAEAQELADVLNKELAKK